MAKKSASSASSRPSNMREEVLNVLLSQLLEDRKIISVPEEITVSAKGKRSMPDVTVDLFGVRMVIEGRFDKNAGTRSSLEKDARQRVEDGISPVCLAVLYPASLSQAATNSVAKKALASNTLEVYAVSESGVNDWSATNVDGITDLLRRVYELLVSEDVVTSSVVEIENAIEVSSSKLIRHRATPSRLRVTLNIPENVQTVSENLNSQEVAEEEGDDE